MSINELITEFDKDKQKQLLEYLQCSNTLGNPVLEEFFIREHASVLQLMKHEELRRQFQLDVESWIAGLEPKLQASAKQFFDSFEDKVRQHAETITKANMLFAEALDRAVQTSLFEIETKAGELEKTLGQSAELERLKTVEALVNTLNNKLDPHVQKAFAGSTDKFRVKIILRDLGVLIAGMSIFYGLSHIF